MSETWLRDFVAESNRIEGIAREPTVQEITAHEAFLAQPSIGVSDVVTFVGIVQPGARLRDRERLNVRVGSHVAPPGGPEIAVRLRRLLGHARGDPGHPAAYHIHRAYETLHPFTDGNGRSGRALWLWMMLRDEKRQHWPERLGFLHSWYYQSLEASRTTSDTEEQHG